VRAHADTDFAHDRDGVVIATFSTTRGRLDKSCFVPWFFIAPSHSVRQNLQAKADG
jgi:hypothetical protein